MADPVFWGMGKMNLCLIYPALIAGMSAPTMAGIQLMIGGKSYMQTIQKQGREGEKWN